MIRRILLGCLCAWSALAAEDPDVTKLLNEALGESGSSLVGDALFSADTKNDTRENKSASSGLAESQVRFLLRPLRSAVLSSNAEGAIGRLSLVAGSSFKKGDVLVKISCAMQEAELSHSEAQRDAAKYEYETNRILRKSNSVGKLAYFKSEQEYKKAAASVSAARVAVKDCVTKAPYAGKVAKVFNKKHQYVQVGQELIEVFDDSVFELKMLVPSSWLSWLKKGYQFEAKLDETDVVFKAEVKRISPKIDSVSKTVPVSASLVDEPPLRLYGMSGVAYFDLENTQEEKAEKKNTEKKGTQ